MHLNRVLKMFAAVDRRRPEQRAEAGRAAAAVLLGDPLALVVVNAGRRHGARRRPARLLLRGYLGGGHVQQAQRRASVAWCSRSRCGLSVRSQNGSVDLGLFFLQRTWCMPVQRVRPFAAGSPPHVWFSVSPLRRKSRVCCAGPPCVCVCFVLASSQPALRRRADKPFHRIRLQLFSRDDKGEPSTLCRRRACALCADRPIRHWQPSARLILSNSGKRPVGRRWDQRVSLGRRRGRAEERLVSKRASWRQLDSIFRQGSESILMHFQPFSSAGRGLIQIRPQSWLVYLAPQVDGIVTVGDCRSRVAWRRLLCHMTSRSLPCAPAGVRRGRLCCGVCGQRSPADDA